MPFLTYDDAHTPRAGRLTRRALIGRRLSHGVVLTDPAVGRLHAWVDPTPGGGWAVSDAGGRAGTTVNGRPVAGDRQDLRNGDVIRVGATRITFHAGDDVPTGAEAVTLSPPPGQPVRTGGILFACDRCASPIWVGNDLAGKRGRCRHCKQPVTVPAAAGAGAAPAEPAPAAGRRQCGVCHAAVAAGEAVTVCPECDTTYHAECWAENYGCSTYGCRQVNALNPDPPAEAVPAQAPTDLAADVAAGPPPEAVAVEAVPAAVIAAPPPANWEWVMALASLLAAVVGVVTFGVPPIATAAAAGVMIARRRPSTRVWMLALAVVVSVAGVIGGVVYSEYLWLGRLP